MLDKKALRKFAAGNPAPAIPANHGLLHAPQVEHIIRTAVKIIGHRRTLVLYVYERKKAADGDPKPVWTMFQAGDDYITLAPRGRLHPLERISVREAGDEIQFQKRLRLLLRPGRAAGAQLFP